MDGGRELLERRFLQLLTLLHVCTGEGKGEGGWKGRRRWRGRKRMEEEDKGEGMRIEGEGGK